MRQRRWIELLSDYDCVIRYHPGKENVVVDALSMKDKEPIRVRALVVTVHNNLPEQIRNAQAESVQGGKYWSQKDFVGEGAIRSRSDVLRQGAKVKGRTQSRQDYFTAGNPVWKWERIKMDFLTKGFQNTSGYDSIWSLLTDY
ncbi:hypothetical protein Tco_0040235 [Tanacetum coccineum]